MKIGLIIPDKKIAPTDAQRERVVALRASERPRSNREISVLTGLTIGTVAGILFRARKKAAGISKGKKPAREVAGFCRTGGMPAELSVPAVAMRFEPGQRVRLSPEGIERFWPTRPDRDRFIGTIKCYAKTKGRVCVTWDHLKKTEAFSLRFLEIADAAPREMEGQGDRGGAAPDTLASLERPGGALETGSGIVSHAGPGESPGAIEPAPNAPDDSGRRAKAPETEFQFSLAAGSKGAEDREPIAVASIDRPEAPTPIADAEHSRAFEAVLIVNGAPKRRKPAAVARSLPTLECGPVTIADLLPHHCRWPDGYSVSGEFLYCGQMKGNYGSYCALHSKKAYSPLGLRHLSRQPVNHDKDAQSNGP